MRHKSPHKTQTSRFLPLPGGKGVGGMGEIRQPRFIVVLPLDMKGGDFDDFSGRGR